MCLKKADGVMLLIMSVCRIIVPFLQGHFIGLAVSLRSVIQAKVEIPTEVYLYMRKG